MKKTTTGMKMTKNNLNKSNDYNIFHKSLKMTTRQLFSDISKHYSCKKLPLA